MDNGSLHDFLKEIELVQDYLTHIQHVDDIVATRLTGGGANFRAFYKSLKSHAIQFHVSKKVFEYKATIISLYGLLEKFIEIWIKDYLNAISILQPNYHFLDEKLKDSHFMLSLKLVNTLQTRESAKYAHITKEQVLSRLTHCIDISVHYRLNSEAFVLLSGNLKHDRISDLLKYINIDLNLCLKRNENFMAYLQDNLQIMNLANLDTSRLYYKINELVDRRNEIAHGAETLNILSIAELRKYIDFLEKYCTAVFEALFEELIKNQAKIECKRVDVIHNVWQNSIIGMEVESVKIEVGDFLIIETPNGNFLKKEILEIQINNNQFSSITIEDKTNVALRVIPPVSGSCNYYLFINSKDE